MDMNNFNVIGLVVRENGSNKELSKRFFFSQGATQEQAVAVYDKMTAAKKTKAKKFRLACIFG